MASVASKSLPKWGMRKRNRATIIIERNNKRAQTDYTKFDNVEDIPENESALGKKKKN